MPAIRVAIKTLKRPTAVIMRDDWYGHRDPFTWDEVGDKDEWLDWDYALIDAVQTIEDFTDDSGILVWEREDPNAVVNAVKRIDRFKEAVEDRTRGQNYKPAPGEYFVPDIQPFDDEGELQTYSQWIEREIAGEDVENFDP